MSLLSKFSLLSALFITSANAAVILDGTGYPCIDPTQLIYLPTEAPDNEYITNIRKKLNSHSTPEEISSICPAIDIIKIEKPWQRKGVCYRVAIKKSLKLTKKEIDSLDMVGCQDWAKIALNDYLRQTDNPQTGTLAVYINSKKDYAIEHFGIVQSNGKVRSKFAINTGIYDHPLWYLPNNWGDNVVFYNLKHKWLNKDMLLIDLKNKIQTDLKIHDTLTWLRNDFFSQCQYAPANNILSYPPHDTPEFYAYGRLKQCPSIDINMRNKELSTPLILAAQRGALNVVLSFIDNNADLNAQNDKGKTALHLAADNNHCNVMRLLLERGANPDIQDNNGNVANIPLTLIYGKPLMYGAIALSAFLTYTCAMNK